MNEFREFQDGELIAGTRYRVLCLIGVGGMGSVYEVEHVELGKRFVLKALLRELARREDLVARLRNEWRALARLQHANIVNVTDAGTSGGGVPFYVMERLDGETLAARLKQKRRLHVIDAVVIAAHVLRALNAAHDIGVIHRDVKPANIFLVASGGVKLLDFGVAKIADATGVVTQRGIAVGTPRYMSPEQARGERVDGRSDIYATGLILFEMITGVGPYDDARDANELVLAQLARRAPALSSRVLGVAPEVERILARMLAKDCRERPSHARTVAEQLQSFVVRYRQSPSTSAPTLAANYGAAMVNAPMARSEGSVLREAPTLSYADTSRQPKAGNSVTTQGAHTVSGQGACQSEARNTTCVSVPAFEASTTLEMVAVPTTSPPSGGHVSPPPNVERPERTEILGEFDAAIPGDAVVTRTQVPLVDVGRPISMTPPPVVQGADFPLPSLRAPRLGRAAVFGAAGVALLAVTAIAARRVSGPAQPAAGAALPVQARPLAGARLPDVPGGAGSPGRPEPRSKAGPPLPEASSVKSIPSWTDSAASTLQKPAVLINKERSIASDSPGPRLPSNSAPPVRSSHPSAQAMAPAAGRISKQAAAALPASGL